MHLQLTPGTNIALLNGMMHVIISEGLMDKVCGKQDDGLALGCV